MTLNEVIEMLRSPYLQNLISKYRPTLDVKGNDLSVGEYPKYVGAILTPFIGV